MANTPAGGCYALSMRTRSRPCGGVLASGLLAALAACTEPPLMRVAVNYSGFEPACMTISVWDVSGSNPRTQPFRLMPGSRDGGLQAAVWHQGGWSSQLYVLVESRELTCGGNLVADAGSLVTVTRGQTLPLSFDLFAPDLDEDGYIAGPRGTDCDDARRDVRPGATEYCNGRDDNCAAGPDDGFRVGTSCGDAGCSAVACAPDGGTFCAPGLAFYPDGDMDGWGRNVTPTYACTAPLNHVPDAGDCEDGTARVHPGLVEVCDGLDNDCVGAVDDGFSLGGSCAAPFGCAGQVTCAPDGGTTCRSDAGTGAYPDEDGDGAGAQVEICVPDGGPTVANANDCDDGDPFTALSFPEICDRRDNDCDGQADDSADGGSVCPAGSSWVGHAAAGGGHAWRSIWSWTDGGAWVGANAGRLRRHLPSDSYTAGTAWTSFDSDCDNKELTGVWADPTGRAFVVSPNTGVYCWHDGTVAQNHSTLVNPLLGDPVSLVGFRIGTSVEVYVAGRDGGTLRWFADGGAQALDFIDGAQLNDIHGSAPGNLFAAGVHTGAPPGDPRIYRFSPGSSSWNPTPLPASIQNTGASVQAVYAVSPRLAYSVTDAGHVLRWDGTSWTLHPSPTDAGLRGVLAFGSSSVFVIDARTAWEWNGLTWTRLMDAGTGTVGLVDLHGTNPADVWIAQDPSLIYRWPQ